VDTAKVRARCKLASVEAIEEEEKELADAERLPPSPGRKATLFPFQERATSKLLTRVLNKIKGQLLLAPVGTGKTFVIGALLDCLKQIGWHEGKTISPWPFVYVTKASIVEQTQRVLEKHFGICTVTECSVINIEQLRASFGELMLKCHIKVVDGEEIITWEWKPGVHPLLICWDECQILKNTDSQQSQIAQAFNRLSSEHYQIFFSATPFMRVCEAKCFALSIGFNTKHGSGFKVTEETWPMYAKMVAAPADPDEYSPAAIDRLMEELDPYIVQIKGVRSQYKALNRIEMIDFQSEESRKRYTMAWERYLAQLAKIQGSEGLEKAQSYFAILVQFLKFRMAAELARAEYIADWMYDRVQNGKAAVCAFSFKPTGKRVMEILHDKYGVPRDLVTFVWGGGQTAPNKKQKAKQKIVSNDILRQILKDGGITMDDLDLDNVDDYVEEKERPELALGPQSLKQRQKEIDAFQSGRSHYCLFTFKAGGVGLSLHHSDELTKVKCRRKKNGWYHAEDISKVPTRPREVILSPTYSAIELVQGLGRAPRLTSMSDTPQVIVFYRGTIEEKVAEIVSKKLRCLRRVIRAKESWEDVIVGGVPQGEREFRVPDEVLDKHTRNTEPDDKDDGVGLAMEEDDD